MFTAIITTASSRLIFFKQTNPRNVVEFVGEEILMAYRQSPPCISPK